MSDIDIKIQETEKLIQNYYSEIHELRNKIITAATDCLITIVVDIINKHKFVVKFVIHQGSFWFSDESGEQIIWDADIINNPENYPDLSQDLIRIVKFLHKNKNTVIFKKNLVINKKGKI